jgi:hypothetical protein
MDLTTASRTWRPVREGGTPGGVLLGRLTARTRRAPAKDPIMRTQRRLPESEREERRERDRETLPTSFLDIVSVLPPSRAGPVWR